jgi:DNA-binding PadR family transcriptional regulator
MDHSGARRADKTWGFELAPPKRFVLPAILLLLSERPGYGYGLVPALEELRFGHVDRPAVYRALAQLERDGLVQVSSQNPKAGQGRRMYQVTALGERVLRAWMGVIKEEHDCLGGVLRRYQATGTTDAILAEVEGGWSAGLGLGWSPVLSTSGGRRRLVAVESALDLASPEPASDLDHNELDPSSGSRLASPSEPRRFNFIPDRSVVLIEVRSTVGPLSFGAIGVRGSLRAALVHGVLCPDVPPTGHLEIDMTGLSSGNRLYDAELLRRIEARRFPMARVELVDCAPSGPGSRYRLKGELSFHAVTRRAEGTVNLEAVSDRRLVITGEQVFDIRDFAIPSPTVLMLRIYPDVRVRLHAEAEMEEAQ